MSKQEEFNLRHQKLKERVRAGEIDKPTYDRMLKELMSIYGMRPATAPKQGAAPQQNAAPQPNAQQQNAQQRPAMPQNAQQHPAQQQPVVPQSQQFPAPQQYPVPQQYPAAPFPPMDLPVGLGLPPGFQQSGTPVGLQPMTRARGKRFNLRLLILVGLLVLLPLVAGPVVYIVVQRIHSGEMLSEDAPTSAESDEEQWPIETATMSNDELSEKVHPVESELPTIDDAAIASALEDIKSSSLLARNRGFKALTECQPLESRRSLVARALEELLMASKFFPRVHSLEALAVWADRDTGPVMLRLLQVENDTFLTSRAIKVLGTLRDRRAIKPLANFLPGEALRSEAADALEAIGPEAEQAVLPYLEHHDIYVRNTARRILATIGRQASIDALDDIIAWGSEEDRKDAKKTKQNILERRSDERQMIDELNERKRTQGQ